MGFLLTNGIDSCAAVLGSWLIGATVLSLPLPARGASMDAYLSQIRGIVKVAEPTAIFVGIGLATTLADARLGARISDVERLRNGPLLAEGDPLRGADIAFVQFSSGSTSAPRGCVLSAQAVASQLAGLAHALEIDPERDRGVTWLPMSHDMGLFGCVLLTYWTGHPLAVGNPQRFIGNPWTWMEDCVRFRATITAAPGFALDLVARIAARRAPQRLSLRKLVIGGEPIAAATLRRVVQSLGSALSASALSPAYGLAEATLAVTATPSTHKAPRILRVAVDALTSGDVHVLDDSSAVSPREPHTRELVSVGVPLPGVSVTISGPRAIGEIAITSPSLALGYLGDPEAWIRRCSGGVLRTGDHGFVVDGELFVVGRQDDMFVSAGRNLYTRDIEQAITAVAGVKPGRVAVVNVGQPHRPRLIALIEQAAADVGVFASLAQRALAATEAECGMRLGECRLIRPGALPKTSSGKLQRHRCIELATHSSEIVLECVALDGRGVS